MTDHTVRLYAATVGLVVFFLFWAAIAAKPWASTGEADPRAAAIERREQLLARETRRVNRVVKRRFAVYSKQLAGRKRAIARRDRENASTLAAVPSAGGSALAASATSAAPAAPSVSVTAAPPVTTTSSS